MQLPDALVRTLCQTHEDAESWLRDFPDYLKELESNWDIRACALVEELSFNIVMTAEAADGVPYILKLSPPGDDLAREAAALGTYGGKGACRLIRTDLAGGALLLERLRPGISLWRTEDDLLAARVCANLLLKLWQPAKDVSPFRTIKSWTRALPAYVTSKQTFLPADLSDLAHGLLQELLQSEDELILLHADLHHGNILSATREPYLAIDPKGILGPKAFDVTAFLRNPIGVSTRPNFEALLERRLDIFREMLGLPKRELAAWGVVHTVLSSCWMGEGSDHQEAILVARKLSRYL